MDLFDISATDQIIKMLTKQLNRGLTTLEMETFKLPRSGMAYEIIIGTIESTSSVEELENYVKILVDEYKTTHNTKL